MTPTFEPNKNHLCEAPLSFSNLKKAAAESHRILKQTYGEHTPSETTCEEWFRCFHSDDFNIGDKQHSRMPEMFEENKLQLFIDNGPRQRYHLAVTGIEEWIYFDNPKRRKTISDRGQSSPSTPKRSIFGKKRASDSSEQSITPEVAGIRDKTAQSHFVHDNVRPHVKKAVKETLEAHRWDVLPQAAYSADCAPSDTICFARCPTGIPSNASKMSTNG
ncbi:hypothetical protein ANCDUO_09480 [Ancylostoma duodenale]|uniref:Mos1 transposase HTH domain-containing protein n=1 Tax=Ancylostoma duodenale TaxID=51022 RepID=A0A0C2GT09_9BILA|nr:hypothetical protein ANCDUO_09480 [Ancylostoma duodenale]